MPSQAFLCDQCLSTSTRHFRSELGRSPAGNPPRVFVCCDFESYCRFETLGRVQDSPLQSCRHSILFRTFPNASREKWYGRALCPPKLIARSIPFNFVIIFSFQKFISDSVTYCRPVTSGGDRRRILPIAFGYATNAMDWECVTKLGDIDGYGKPGRARGPPLQSCHHSILFRTFQYISLQK